MKIIITVLTAAVLFAGCMTHGGRRIREVSYFESKVTGERSSHTTQVTFRRDGTAERRQLQLLYPNEVILDSTATARFAPIVFERLAKAIEQNNFFEKQNGPRDDKAKRVLFVDSDDREKSLENPDKNDQQVQTILSAVSDFEMTLAWKAGK